MLRTLTVNSQSEPVDQFLKIEDAARLLGFAASDIRQGIACGLIPIRRDNAGDLRIHQIEVPEDLPEQIKRSPVDPLLHAQILIDEVSTLRNELAVSEEHRSLLEKLVIRQADAISRSAALLESRESDTARLSSLLENAEAQYAHRIQQLSDTTDNTMELLERAVSDAEIASSEVNRLQALMSSSLESSKRMEGEIDQRNVFIDKQHDLMQRLVTVSEQSSSASKPVAVQRRTLWQWLWGRGKGI